MFFYMAAVLVQQPSSLILKYLVAVEDGKSIYMTRSYSRVKPAASDDSVYNVAVTLFSLSDYGPGTITRTDKGELVEAI
jgi:hypothetical protein